VRSRAAFGGITIDVDAALVALCKGRTGFKELEAADLVSTIRPGRMTQAAPDSIKLPGGRQVKVHYEPGKPPWIESRLQDSLGCARRLGSVVRLSWCICSRPITVRYR